MSRLSGGQLLATLGGYWFAFALVSLILSTALPGARAFLSGLTLWSHMGLWVMVMLPGIILLFVADRKIGGEG